MPANLYVAWGYENGDENTERLERYVRAHSRDDAKNKILDDNPDAKFYR
jgi:hypothetical protein